MVAALFEAASAVRQQGDDVASRAGQSLARWEVLYILGEAPGSAAQVARRLGRTRQAVQRVIDLLAAEALIVATPNPDHRRSPRFHLSESGRNTLVTINSAAADWHRMVLEEFDLEELEQLADSLQRLTRVARRWPCQGRGGEEAEQL